jgi:hypothetical protein
MAPSPQPRTPSPLFHSQKAQPENPFSDPQNPFADPEKAPAPIPAPAPAHTPSPLADHFLPIQAPPPAPAPVERKPAPVNKSMNIPSLAPTIPASSPGPMVAGAAAAAATGAIAAGALAASSHPGTSNRMESPREQPREFAPPPAAASPAPSTPVSIPPAVAAAAAASSPGPESPAGNVYRVLMDFVPSMEDELDLKTGQLVRLLHEYDDGWVSQSTLRILPILTFLGSLYQTRPFATRCRSEDMSRGEAFQTQAISPQPVCSRSRWGRKWS